MLVDAFIRAKREEVRLPGDLVLVVLSDEEAGGDLGAKFLVEEHPELFEGIRYALGEFGGFTIYAGGRRFYAIQVAEKQICWLKATVRGPGGHGALVHRGGTVARLGKLLTDLDRKRMPVHVLPLVRELVETIAATLPRHQAAVMRSRPEAAPHRHGAAAACGEEARRCSSRCCGTPSTRRSSAAARRSTSSRARSRSSWTGARCPGFSPEQLMDELQEHRRRRRRARADPARPGPVRAGPRALRDARRRHPRARPGRDPGAAPADRRHRRPLLLARRHPDLRLPADAAAGGLRVREADPRRRRADPGRRRSSSGPRRSGARFRGSIEAPAPRRDEVPRARGRRGCAGARARADALQPRRDEPGALPGGREAAGQPRRRPDRPRGARVGRRRRSVGLRAARRRRVGRPARRTRSATTSSSRAFRCTRRRPSRGWTSRRR